MTLYTSPTVTSTTPVAIDVDPTTGVSTATWDPVAQTGNLGALTGFLFIIAGAIAASLMFPKRARQDMPHPKAAPPQGIAPDAGPGGRE